MSPEYKSAQSIVGTYAATALIQTGNDSERALDLLRFWGEADRGLAGALALVGCQSAINEQCRELMQV